DENNYQLFSYILATVDQVDFETDRVGVKLNWESGNLDNIRNQAQQIFISAEDRERLLYYHDQITAIATAAPAGQARVGLNDFLVPLFDRARERSGRGEDPVADNRALFIAMTTYLTELRLEHLLGDSASSLTYPRRLTVVIEGRSDLPQHIVGSAAIAASAGGSVADILSVYKEVHDSRYTSGFSFSDLTANQVGAELGMLATTSPELARQLQILMSESLSETDYMPPVARFDGITEEEFISQYQDRNSAQYQQRLAAIAEEIADRPIFQTLDSATGSSD
ncbi:MAG: hypothetical protein WD601_14285, partial [Pseudohongiellaceae bacterium]